MWRWLMKPVTPPGFDVALALVGGVGGLLIAAVNAAAGEWRGSAWFAFHAASALLGAWLLHRRSLRSRPVQKAQAPNEPLEPTGPP